MKRTLAILTVVAALAAGCFGSTKTGQGQLYRANDPRYDPFFADVHKAQVTAASWPDEQKAAKKPIAEALDLPTTASYSTIVSATREKKGAPALGHAIDSSVNAHRDLAKRMHEESERLSALAKKGSELETSASEDRTNMGADKADDEKVKKKEEVKSELSAAQSEAASLARRAKNTAREAEAFAIDVKRAYDGKDPEPRTTKTEEPKPEATAKPAETKPAEPTKPPEPPPKPAAKPPPPKKAGPEGTPPLAPPPKPKADPPPPKPPPPKPNPAPTQKPNDEVFNP